MDNYAGYREFACDVCGSSDPIEAPYTRLYTNDEPLSICKSCGFVYVKSRRSSKAIADWWSEKLYGSHYVPRLPAIRARQTYVAEFLDQYISLKGKYVIDVGAGEGQFLAMLKNEFGADVFGVEPSTDNAQKLNALGIPNFIGTAEGFGAARKKGDKKADIVTIIWTLENCMSSKDVLDVAWDLLDEKGLLLIATGSRILVPFKKPLHYYIGSDEPQDIHPFRFTKNTLSGALAKSSLRLEHCNQFLDSDVLCAIASKQMKGTEISWERDNYLKVSDFFIRWHFESMHYR